MEVRLWRLVKAGRTAWDGEGAFRFGGRWNSRGVRMVYASSSLALALLEVLVHLDPAVPMPAMRAISASVPEEEIAEIPGHARASDPGGNAIRFPYSLHESRQLGDEWTRSNAGALLAVPSAIVPTERNFLINPAHPGFQKVAVGRPQEFLWDERLARLPDF